MKPTAAAAALALCALLAGCADNTGEIDAQGHNGFDRVTCTDAKAFALDVQYGALTTAQATARMQQLSTELARASDADIRQASTALLSGYRSGSPQAVATAVTSLMKACQL